MTRAKVRKANSVREPLHRSQLPTPQSWRSRRLWTPTTAAILPLHGSPNGKAGRWCPARLAPHLGGRDTTTGRALPVPSETGGTAGPIPRPACGTASWSLEELSFSSAESQTAPSESPT